MADAVGKRVAGTLTATPGGWQFAHTATTPGIYILTITSDKGVARGRVALR